MKSHEFSLVWAFAAIVLLAQVRASVVLPSHVTNCGDGWFSKISSPSVNAREICEFFGYTDIDMYGGNGGSLCSNANNRGGNCCWDCGDSCGNTVDFHCSGHKYPYPGNHILLASDSRWSDIDDEDVKLQQAFEDHGFTVSKMSGFTTGSLNLQLSGYSHFVYPEPEVGAMSTYFDDNDYDALSNWIDFGGYWTSFHRADSITIMNAMFDWSIFHQSGSCGTVERISDILKGGPQSLQSLSGTYKVKTSSLPSEATCVYGTGDCCYVFVASVGDGVVSWLGWDWYHTGSGAEDWNDVAALTLMSGYADVKACHWISIDLNSKDIKGADFFGYECPSKEFISEIMVQRYKSNSHLHNNPVGVRCCEIAGTHHVTETCVDHFTQEVGTAEDALCEGNSVLSGMYNFASQIVDQNDLEYDQTMAHRCCEISECEAEYCTEGNGLSIDESSCITIGHESDPESDGELSILSCPAETVLKKIIDVDVAVGVQEVYEIECCDLVQVARPSSSPSFSPSHSPSVSPTTTCMNCLMTLHKENIANDQLAMSRYQECLDNHCCA